MRPKVLIVHENESVRDTMHRSLVEEHCEVMPCATVSDALALIVKDEFDDIIVNLESSQDLHVLIAGIHNFQPDAMIVAVSNALTKQQLDLYHRLRGNIVMKPSNITQIVRFLPAHTKENEMEPWIARKLA